MKGEKMIEVRKVILYESLQNKEETEKAMKLLQKHGFIFISFPADDIYYPEVKYKNRFIYRGVDEIKELIQKVEREGIEQPIYLPDE